MFNLTLPQFASVSQLQRSYTQLLKIVKEKGSPLFLLRKNKPEAVILDIKLYEAMLDGLRKMEEIQALEAINIYRSEKKSGRLKKMESLDELFE